MGIPTLLIGGTKFYERMEIKDMVAYLRVIVNNDDDVSMRRIINTPRRGIGDKAEEAIVTYARRMGISFGAAIERADQIPELSSRAVAALREFVTMLRDLRVMDDSGAGPAEIVDATMRKSGYLAELSASRDVQDESRVDNLGELENAAREFEVAFLEESEEERPATLTDFLQRSALQADSDNLQDAEAIEAAGGKVTLMTVHTAKGLEFPVVFVAGMEDGVFPHQRSIGNDKEIEEERRLAYVALTRAKRHLYLTRAVCRTAWGQPAYNPESRFLAEIPDEFAERSGGAARPLGSSFSAPSRVSSSGPIGVGSSSIKKNSDVEILALSIGDKVMHEKFGQGTVTKVEGQGENTKVSVNFPSGVKQLLLRYAPVTKL
jgi:DNA helicase-2/ATP-dependent DNA helicase PcrA